MNDALLRAAQDVARAVADENGAALLAGCDLTTLAGEKKAARLRSLSGSGQGGWLDAMPCVPATRLSGPEFEATGRLRLGLGLATNVRIPPCTCRQGAASAADHAQTCDHAKGEGRMRHDLLTSVWRSIIGKARLPSAAEPRVARLTRTAQGMQQAGGHRGDIAVVIGTQVVVTDTVVTHPAADAYVRAAARTSGSAAKRAEDRKVSTFRSYGDTGGVRFVPLATESYGRHGAQAMSFLSEVGNVVARAGGSKSAFVRAARVELSVALARGNARMYYKTLTNVVRASGDAFLPGSECVFSGHTEE